MTTQPALRVLSLGAGVQSTTLLMLSAEGRLPKLDAAIFADTGWEPRAVYEHLDRLEREVAQPAGIPIHRVSVGNIREDALDPAHRFASMPLFIKNQDGGDGMTRRQCTAEYKLKPIKRQVRQLLGHPHPAPVPRGVFAEQWIGISKDEIGRWTARTGLYYTGVEVGGARRLKSGGLGTGASDSGVGSRDWPEWMAALVAEHTPDFTR